MPRRVRVLPAQVWAAIDAADVVVHAGDWVTPALLDEFVARSARLIGVWGNNDGPEPRRRLPEVARVRIEGLRLAVYLTARTADGALTGVEPHRLSRPR